MFLSLHDKKMWAMLLSPIYIRLPQLQTHRHFPFVAKVMCSITEMYYLKSTNVCILWLFCLLHLGIQAPVSLWVFPSGEGWTSKEWGAGDPWWRKAPGSLGKSEGTTQQLLASPGSQSCRATRAGNGTGGKQTSWSLRERAGKVLICYTVKI